MELKGFLLRSLIESPCNFGSVFIPHCVFLFSLLSLAFVLGFDVKKCKGYNQDFIYYDEVFLQKKRRIQKEMWYQRERNKEISVLQKETKSLCRILGEMQQELDVLMALVDAQ